MYVIRTNLQRSILEPSTSFAPNNLPTINRFPIDKIQHSASNKNEFIIIVEVYKKDKNSCRSKASNDVTNDRWELKSHNNFSTPCQMIYFALAYVWHIELTKLFSKLIENQINNSTSYCGSNWITHWIENKFCFMKKKLKNKIRANVDKERLDYHKCTNWRQSYKSQF